MKTPCCWSGGTDPAFPGLQAPALKSNIGIRLDDDVDTVHLPVHGKRTHDRIIFQGASVVHNHQRVPPSIPGTDSMQDKTRDIVAQFPSALNCGEVLTLELQVPANLTVTFPVVIYGDNREKDGR